MSGTNPSQHPWLGAVVLAAGQSRRMGRAKQILPWGSQTVVEAVVETLQQAGAGEIIVVTGAAHGEVERALKHTSAQVVFNPEFASAEMLTSLKVGLQALSAPISAALVALGDQPMIERAVVEAVVSIYRTQTPLLVIPSYQMRRGHPWLLDRKLWPNLLQLPEQLTMRDFLNQQSDQITYVNVETPSVLQDLDTPADYDQLQPK